MDHTHLLSKTMCRRFPPMVATFSLQAKSSSNVMMLAGGWPNPILFPFKEMTLTMRDGREVNIDQKLMAKCLQYGSPQGLEPLLEQLKTLTKKFHDPPQWQQRDVIVLVGSQSGIAFVFEMLVDPEDFILIPEPAYTGVFTGSQSLGSNLVPVKCDADGVRPDDLKDVLESCRASSKGRPKVLYLNPSGSNPTGIVWSETRRRLIYEIACHYDIIILEDDPYYFLEFNEDMTPSFLHLDTECRVIRLDSFSKVVSAGLRLGYATGHRDLIEKLKIILMSTLANVSLVTQACVSRMLDTMGIDGFIESTRSTRDYYKSIKDLVIKAAERHLNGLCEWQEPNGGIYLWLKVKNVADTNKLIFGRALAKGFLATPGAAFLADEKQSSQYIRISYSSIDPQQIEEGVKVLAEAIREELKEGKNITEG